MDYYEPEYNIYEDMPAKKSKLNYYEVAEKEINDEIKEHLKKSVDEAIKYVRFDIMATKNTLNRENLSNSQKDKLTLILGLLEKKLVELNEKTKETTKAKKTR